MRTAPSVIARKRGNILMAQGQVSCTMRGTWLRYSLFNSARVVGAQGRGTAVIAVNITENQS